jgi:hypothetical protein
MDMKTDSQLEEIINDNPESLDSEAIVAAENEIKKRKENQLFNLLPIMPLDGGQMIRSLFFQNNEKINIVFIWISIIVLSLIALKLESYMLLIIPFFLFMQIKNQTQLKNIKTYIKNKGFEIDRDFKALSNEEYWLIRDEIALNIQAFSNLIEPKRYYPIPAENRVINVMKQVVQKQPIKDIKIIGKIFFLL